MSFDVGLYIDTGGADPVEVSKGHNYTYNCSRMFHLALGGNGIDDLNGISGGEAIALLERGVAHMSGRGNAAEYEALNPSNGWGNHEGATRFLTNILRDCQEHPKAVVVVS